MTDEQKRRSGALYDANYDEDLLAERMRCQDLCHRHNQISPSQMPERQAALQQILGKTGERFRIEQPFYCDYGKNITIGEDFYANYNLVILDAAEVSFGEHAFIAPNCGFYTAGHPLDAARRNAGLEYARPIRVGNHVWIGAHVVVLPGVTIGDYSIIGAGSVVLRDVPSGVLAAGNPCRVIRPLTEEERMPS